eukprot:gene10298-21497_t
MDRMACSSHCVCPHPLDPLSPDEISSISSACRAYDWKRTGTFRIDNCLLRFNTITLKEPTKLELVAFLSRKETSPSKIVRTAFVILQFPPDSLIIEADVVLSSKMDSWSISSWKILEGVHALVSPDDCLESEMIAKSDPLIQDILLNKYGISDMTMVCCDPWSVHNPPFPGRLIQLFMYIRIGNEMDNAYAHPLSFIPIIDLNLHKVIHIDEPYPNNPPQTPTQRINYHHKLCEIPLRTDLKPLHILQPDGPSFIVNGNEIQWQKWNIRISFNYREGLVLHTISYNDNGNIRPIIHRASLVEMAVPYADPTYPFTRKCAFDVGDYGLGNCTSSLTLGCDCLGYIHYFDAVLNNSQGHPVIIKKAICLHEEDHGTLWKHVEFRNGHSEVRRSRRLVISFVATVVNYEYAFYWYFYQDGTIQYEIKLTGELSTNILSPHEINPSHPSNPTSSHSQSQPHSHSLYGTMVAPGVNAQFHQHLFCVRLDMSVDDIEGCGRALMVTEVDLQSLEEGPDNIAGNAFITVETPLLYESEAQRVGDANKQRVWKISNPSSIHPITNTPVAWKVIIPPSALLLASSTSLLSRRGLFASKQLWVTPHCEGEWWPAGDYTLQSTGGEGIGKWIQGNRPCGPGYDPVLWLTLAATHVPRVEDFPVMPVETVGFVLKPFSFFGMNPAVDVPPANTTTTATTASVLSGSSCCCSSNKN